MPFDDVILSRMVDIVINFFPRISLPGRTDKDPLYRKG